MAELKVVYGNTNAKDFCVKEGKQSYIQMDEIMKRLFSLQNKVPIIDFLNAVYKDNISYSAKITYGNREITSLDKEKIKFISFYADMYIRVENGKINIRDYDEMTTIIENIHSYFLDMYGKYENIDEEVRNMVKSFYDPKVEERGIEKGKIEVAKNLLKMGMDLLAIMQATGLSKEEIKKIEADMN